MLEEFIRQYSIEGHNHPKIFRLYWLSLADGGKNSLQTRKHLEKVYQKMAELLQIGMSKGEFRRRDPDLAAFMVMSLINAPLITHFCGNKPVTITCEEVLEENILAVNAYLSS